MIESSSRRWTVQDREGNPIYLTAERWQHIIEGNNHPEMADYEDHLKTTIQRERRHQELLNPRKYRYVQPFEICRQDSITSWGIVLFGFDVNAQGETVPNNFIATAFLKYMRLRGG